MAYGDYLGAHTVRPAAPSKPAEPIATMPDATFFPTLEPPCAGPTDLLPERPGALTGAQTDDATPGFGWLSLTPWLTKRTT